MEKGESLLMSYKIFELAARHQPTTNMLLSTKVNLFHYISFWYSFLSNYIIIPSK